jgi:hypothetical protein
VVTPIYVIPQPAALTLLGAAPIVTWLLAGPPPPERTIYAHIDSRSVVAFADRRTIKPAMDTRTITAALERRTVTAAVDDRTVTPP